MENETVSAARVRGIKLFKDTIRAVRGSNKWRVEAADGFTYATRHDQDPYSGAGSITIVQFSSSPNKDRRYARIRSHSYKEDSLVSEFDDRLLIPGCGKPLTRLRMRSKPTDSSDMAETPVKGSELKQILLGYTIKSL